MAYGAQKTHPEQRGTPKKTKIGLVLQGAASLGAYEVGAIEYLYENHMECAIVAGASSGAMNAVTLAGAKGDPPTVLRQLWEGLAVDPPIPFVPSLAERYLSMFGVPHMYTPRWDYWNLLTWTSFSDTTPFKKNLEGLLDWEQVNDPEHMRVFVSASGVETGETTYFSNIDPKKPLKVEHVMASGSFPIGFPWTMVNHRAYWDGGLTDNTPLKPVINNLPDIRRRDGMKTSSMPIFMINPFSSSASLPMNLYQVALRFFEILMASSQQEDVDRAHSYTHFIRVLHAMKNELPPDALDRIAKEYKEDYDEVMNYALVNNIRMIDMMKPAEESAMDYSRETILRRIEAGYEAARRALKANSLKGVRVQESEQEGIAPLTEEGSFQPPS